MTYLIFTVGYNDDGESFQQDLYFSNQNEEEIRTHVEHMLSEFAKVKKDNRYRRDMTAHKKYAVTQLMKQYPYEFVNSKVGQKPKYDHSSIIPNYQQVHLENIKAWCAKFKAWTLENQDEWRAFCEKTYDENHQVEIENLQIDPKAQHYMSLGIYEIHYKKIQTMDEFFT